MRASLLADILQTLWPYGLAFSRWLSFMLVLPGVGDFFVSPRIRFLLALGVSACVTPMLLERALLAPTLSFPFLLQEMAIGLFLGLLVRIFLEMISVAGAIISHEASLTNMLSAFFEAESQSLVASFLKIYFLTFLFTTDMHLLFFKAVSQSYSFFPPGEPVLYQDMTRAVLGWIVRGFEVAVQMSAPFLICGLCYHVLLGLVGRLIPQVPFFFVARPLEIGLGLLGLMVCLMGMTVLFQATCVDALRSSLGA